MKQHYQKIIAILTKTDLFIPLSIGLLIGGLFAPRLLAKNILMVITVILIIISYLAFERRLMKESLNWKLKYELLKEVVKSTELDLFNYTFIEEQFNQTSDITSDQVKACVNQDNIFRAMVSGKITQKVFGSTIDEELDNVKINKSLNEIFSNLKNK